MAGPMDCAWTVLRTVAPNPREIPNQELLEFHCHMNLNICVCFTSVCVISYIGGTEIHVQLSFLKYGPAATSFSME